MRIKLFIVFVILIWFQKNITLSQVLSKPDTIKYNRDKFKNTYLDSSIKSLSNNCLYLGNDLVVFSDYEMCTRLLNDDSKEPFGNNKEPQKFMQFRTLNGVNLDLLGALSKEKTLLIEFLFFSPYKDVAWIRRRSVTCNEDNCFMIYKGNVVKYNKWLRKESTVCLIKDLSVKRYDNIGITFFKNKYVFVYFQYYTMQDPRINHLLYVLDYSTLSVLNKIELDFKKSIYSSEICTIDDELYLEITGIGKTFYLRYMIDN